MKAREERRERVNDSGISADDRWRCSSGLKRGRAVIRLKKKKRSMNRPQLDRWMHEWAERGGKKRIKKFVLLPLCILPTRSFITFPPIICYSHTKKDSNLHL